MVATLAVVVLVVGALTASAVWWRGGDGAGIHPDWQSPPQTRLTSMRLQPVPGWHASVTDLGVPAPGPAAAVRIATSEDPFHSGAFVGNLGDTAYFVVDAAGAAGPSWWLVGIDVRTGRRLFPAVPVDAGVLAPECFLNGPDMLVCLSDERDDVTAWVIDAHSGTVTYTGPTDLRTYPAHLMVHQVGSYAVAETQHQGVYGIGPRAETTWFVPGGGSVNEKFRGPSDFAPLSVVTQTVGRLNTKVVFTLAQGKVIEPQLSDGAEQAEAVVYPGGFAAVIEYDSTRREVQFFDDTGKRLGKEGISGILKTHATDLPIVGLASGGWAVFTPDGGKLLQGAGKMPQQARLIGSTFFLEDPEDTLSWRWQSYDVRTGARGEACSYDLDRGYLGTDGQVGVFESGNPNVGLVTKGIDLATCDVLWQTKSPVGSFRDVWRINTTLVQLSDDGTELTSLVAPG